MPESPLDSSENLNSKTEAISEPHISSAPEAANSRVLTIHETESLPASKTNAKPGSERRGVLSMVTLIPEYYNPKNYSRLQKRLLLAVVAFAGTSGPMGTSIMLPTVSDISRSLNTKDSIVNISVGIYLLALGIFPMWWSNFAENHGRRNVYVTSFFIFLVFTLGSCFVRSIEALIVLRFLSGIGASAIQACGAATVADLFIQEERGTALGLFYLGPLLGPFISPVLGGATSEAWGWRASLWVMVIICLFNLLLIVFLLPETSQHVNSNETKKNWLSSSYDCLIRPLHAVVLVKYPPVALLILYSSIGFMGVYFLNISLTYNFSRKPYNFNIILVGLTYIPNSVAYILTSIYGGKFNDFLLRRYAKRHGGKLRMEARISWNVVTSAIIYPPACALYGWSIHCGAPWAVPLIGSAFFGISTMLLISVTMTCLVDILPGKGGTAIAVNNLFRQSLATIATFTAEPLMSAVGTGVLFSIYAGIITIAVYSMWHLKKNMARYESQYSLDELYALL